VGEAQGKLYPPAQWMTGRSEGVIVCRQGYQSWRLQSAESAARHSLRQQPERLPLHARNTSGVVHHGGGVEE